MGWGDLPGPHKAYLALNRRGASAPKTTQTGYFLGPFGPNLHGRSWCVSCFGLGVERTLFLPSWPLCWGASLSPDSSLGVRLAHPPPCLT